LRSQPTKEKSVLIRVEDTIDEKDLEDSQQYIYLLNTLKEEISILQNIGDEYFMPVVRNVPTFPKHPVKPGDTWTGEGFEAHDFRDAFGIEKPFTFPFKVEYQYIGIAEIDGQIYRHITASYNLNHVVPQEVFLRF